MKWQIYYRKSWLLSTIRDRKGTLRSSGSTMKDYPLSERLRVGSKNLGEDINWHVTSFQFVTFNRIEVWSNLSMISAQYSNIEIFGIRNERITSEEMGKTSTAFRMHFRISNIISIFLIIWCFCDPLLLTKLYFLRIQELFYSKNNWWKINYIYKWSCSSLPLRAGIVAVASIIGCVWTLI